jgi:hypothetical protein
MAPEWAIYETGAAVAALLLQYAGATGLRLLRFTGLWDCSAAQLITTAMGTGTLARGPDQVLLSGI